MTPTLKQSLGDITFLNLGSANSKDLFRANPDLANIFSLIEVDALPPANNYHEAFFRHICVAKAVAGRAGNRTFIQRRFPDCSSFLDPKPDIVESYGLDHFFERTGAKQIECASVSDILKEAKVEQVDLFKTDLEGMDFEVISSASDLVSKSLCVQCELRFQPFYQTEPDFYEVAGYLSKLGFELISLRPEIWKYATSNRNLHRDGRLVWADGMFFRNERNIIDQFDSQAWKCFAKQIIIAKLFGLNNFAEHLFMKHSPGFPTAVRVEMEFLVKPRFNLLIRICSLTNKIPFGWALIAVTRRLLEPVLGALSVYRQEHLFVCGR